VYAGNTTNDTMLAEFTGTMMPQTLLYNCSAMLVRFTTGHSGKSDGFEVGYESYTSPGNILHVAMFLTGSEMPNFTSDSPVSGTLTELGSWAFYSLIVSADTRNISISLQYSSLLNVSRKLLGVDDSPFDIYLQYVC